MTECRRAGSRTSVMHTTIQTILIEDHNNGPTCLKTIATTYLNRSLGCCLSCVGIVSLVSTGAACPSLTTVPLISFPLFSPPRIHCCYLSLTLRVCVCMCVRVCVTPSWPPHGKCHILSVGVKYEKVCECGCVRLCVCVCDSRKLSSETRPSLVF